MVLNTTFNNIVAVRFLEEETGEETWVLGETLIFSMISISCTFNTNFLNKKRKHEYEFIIYFFSHL